MPITFSKSWNYGILSLWGWLSCGQYSSDHELQNDIQEFHAEATKALAKVRRYPKSSERGILKAEWRSRLTALESKPLEYGEGLSVRDELEDMLRQIEDTLHTEAAEARARQASDRGGASSSLSRRLPDPDTDSDSDDDAPDLSDDQAFLKGYSSVSGVNGGPSKVTTTQPRRVAPRPLPTPQTRWADEQRTLEAQCAQVSSTLMPGTRARPDFGAHGVNQQAVLDELPNIAGARWLQGRPDNSGNEVRVMIAVDARDKVVCRCWTNGLSHHAHRVAGTFVVYQQNGDRAAFTRLSATRHPKDPGP